MRNHAGRPLNIWRRFFLAAGISALALPIIAGLLSVPYLRAQSLSDSSARPKFDVASIKLNTSGDPRSGTHNLPGGRVTITNQRLRDVIRTAYGSNDLEVIGGPDWMDADRWDIVAAAAPGDPNAPWERMLKSLLAERFTLQARVEQRERPIYNLTFARSDKRLGPDMDALGRIFGIGVILFNAKDPWS